MGLPREQGGIAIVDVATSPKKVRFLTLDALRGVGAIAVMAGHAGIVLGAYMPPFMYLAVDMFFVLSGFVLAHAYDRKFAEGLSVGAFLKARIARLYPIYLSGWCWVWSVSHSPTAMLCLPRAPCCPSSSASLPCLRHGWRR